MSLNLYEIYRYEFACFHTRYVLDRHVAGVKDIEGRWEESPTTELTFDCSPPQPVKMNELEQLTDGEQIRDYVRVYSPDLVQTREGDVDADIIHIPPYRYEVVSVHNRQTHYRIIMKRLLP